MNDIAQDARPSPLVSFVLRHGRWIFLIATLLFLLAARRTVLTYQALRSDLEELLPKGAPATRALDELRERLPGIRHLGVVVAVDDPRALPAAHRFIDDLAQRVRKYPSSMVSAVRVDARKEREFAERYSLQLMELGDVVRLRQALERRRDWEVTHDLDLSLEDETESPRPEVPVEELEAKYRDRFGNPRVGPGDRFVSPDGKSAVLLIQAGAHETGREADATLVRRVQTDIQALGFPAAYSPSLRVGFAGDVAMHVEELEALQSDLAASGVVVLVLVVSVLLWFYRSWRALPIIGIPLLYGAVMAFGVVALPPLGIVYLNSNTAFLGSIVVGNGINGGIMLLARFQEQRRLGTDRYLAIDRAVQGTWKATLAAALAASAAYGSLVFTETRGFNQFGWIGGIGLILCWATTYALLPFLAVRWGGPLGASGQAGASIIPQRFAGHPAVWVARRPRLVLTCMVALGVVATAGLLQRTGGWIEYDLSKLRRRDTWEVGERYWGQRMDAALGRYLTPVVILAEGPAEAEAIEARVRKLEEKGKAGDLIASVRSAATFLRPDRERNIEEARKLKRILTPRMLGKLSESQRRLLDRALSDASMVPLEKSQIPASLVMGLKEHDGRIDRNVMVIPRLTPGTWNAERLDGFAHDLRQAAWAGSEPRAVAGPLLLSSDIAHAMRSDGPRATGLALVAVLVICWLAFRAKSRRRGLSRYSPDHASLGLSAASIASLFVGVLLMLGGLAWSGAKLNFCNFVALPITFGIAADYSINMLRRYQSDVRGSLDAALASTGGAVALCSATTIIGFGSLIMAKNQALFSFGVVAIAGELTCLSTAVLALPAALSLWERRAHARHDAEKAAVTG